MKALNLYHESWRAHYHGLEPPKAGNREKKEDSGSSTQEGSFPPGRDTRTFHSLVFHPSHSDEATDENLW